MKNQVFIVFDSLRWDVFEAARVPRLKGLGEWKRAYTQGTYTYPAHWSFFTGRLPQTDDGSSFYDTAARRVKGGRGKRLWGVRTPESKAVAKYNLRAFTVPQGFSELGYRTLGSGGVNWFNPETIGGSVFTGLFDHFYFLHPSQRPAAKQVKWAAREITDSDSPYFLFINFSETHHPYVFSECGYDGDPVGDYNACFIRQAKCLEHLEGVVMRLLDCVKDSEVVMCSDHGDAWGEDGRWLHGFYHEKVMEVPMLIFST